MARERARSGVTAAVAALLVGALLAGCDPADDEAPSPLDGLRACDGSSEVVGVFTGQTGEYGFDTWVLDATGEVRQLTDDGVYKAAAISPDARMVYLGRSSGEIQGDSMEAPDTIERLDLATGEASDLVRLSSVGDLSVSANGRWLAVQHYLGDTVGHSGVSVVDLTTGEVRTVPPPADAERFPFVAPYAVAISPDGRQVAYSYVVEIEPYSTEETLRLQDVDGAAHKVLFAAPRLGHISDVVWSPDGETVIAAWRSIHDVQIRRVDVATGAVNLFDGFASYISPITNDGTRLLGVTSSEEQQNAGRGSVTAWDGDTRVIAPLPVTPAASGVSVAACSYRQ